MKAINAVVDVCVEVFGGLAFLAIYNVVTVVWVTLGIFMPGFPDPFPSNFYTLTVSWLAINMTILVLWAERRSSTREQELKKRQQQQEQQQFRMIEVLVALSESHEQILQHLVKQSDENDGDLAKVVRLLGDIETRWMETVRLIVREELGLADDTAINAFLAATKKERS